jgi:predicted Zn-dependent protease
MRHVGERVNCGAAEDGVAPDRLRRWGAALGLAGALALPSEVPAQTQGGISLIRDAEIEQTLAAITDPILDAAGIAPDAVKIYIVKDSQLNAFVAGGMNLFINTGLLMRTEHPGQLAGVIAHEVGHIAGGHLSRVGGAQRRAAAEMILATVLGAAAAVAGAPQLGTAIITGGQTVAQGNYMSFSRSQEQAADQAGLTFLARAGISPRGLAEFFHILDNQNVLTVASTNPYLRSHPLTRDRINFVESRVGPDDAAAPPLPQAWIEGHARMVAKLTAFLEPPGEALAKYQGDNSLTGRYARAIALYRLPDLDAALAEIDRLIGEHPDDPYFHELKGQMLFENGRIEAAVEPYREAVALAPTAAMLHVGLARALIESGAAPANQEAIGALDEALRLEPNNAGAWRQLGIARGRAGEEGESSLALAEWALLVGKDEDARLYARRAEARIERGDPAWLRLQDLLRVIEQG